MLEIYYFTVPKLDLHLWWEAWIFQNIYLLMVYFSKHNLLKNGMSPFEASYKTTCVCMCIQWNFNSSFKGPVTHHRCTSPELNRSTKLTMVRQSAELRRDSTWTTTIGHWRAADPFRGATSALPTLTKPSVALR